MKYDPVIVYLRAKIADDWAEAPEGSSQKERARRLMTKPYSWWVERCGESYDSYCTRDERTEDD